MRPTASSLLIRGESPGRLVSSIREAAATVAAWLDVNVLKPTPVLGEKLPIGG